MKDKLGTNVPDETTKEEHSEIEEIQDSETTHGGTEVTGG
jgi:hypothetical protein